jgi:hypothetical protein
MHGVVTTIQLQTDIQTVAAAMATSKFTDIYYSNKCKQRQLQPKKPQQAG